MGALPAVDTTQIEAKHQSSLTGFAQRAGDLERRVQKHGVTALIAAEAHELDTEAKRWLDAFNAETEPTRSALFQAHRRFTDFCGKMASGAANARKIAARLIGAYALEQQRVAEEHRRENERIAREVEERRQQAEADALLADAAQAEQAGDTAGAAALLDEAQEVAAAPIVSVALPQVAAPKMAGSSTTFKLVGTVIDPVRYVCWLLGVTYTPQIAARADLLNEVVTSWSPSGINAQLKRGLRPDGLRIERQPITRNLSARSGQ